MDAQRYRGRYGYSFNAACPEFRTVATAIRMNPAAASAPGVTLSPTLVTKADGSPAFVLSTPGADNQDQALLQILINVSEFGMDAEASIEAPRYQTRHMVASLDNHAWNIGSLLLDERISPDVAQELVKRGHIASWMSKYSNGSAPVLIKVLPNGVMEAGADPFYNRSMRAR